MGITAINGVAITASLSLSASNTVSAQSASSVTVTDTTTGTGPYYVMFADGTTGNRSARVDSSALTFNATTNTLTATSSHTTQASSASLASSVTLTLNTTNASDNYIPYGLTSAGGGPAPQVFSQSGNLRFTPSTSELRAGLVNAGSQGSRNYTADANLTIDASLTQSVAWVASLTATRSLIVNNLTDGRAVEVYIRNTNATQRQIIFSGSASTTGHVLINMATPFLNGASTTTQNIPATNGTIYPRIKNIAGTFVGGL